MQARQCSGCRLPHPLNESPSEKEGKSRSMARYGDIVLPSMKVPPKRKGNKEALPPDSVVEALNESPSEKEGKCYTFTCRKKVL